MSQDAILALAWRAFASDQTPEAALDYCVKKQRVEGPSELGDLTYLEVISKLDLSKDNKTRLRGAFASAYERSVNHRSLPGEISGSTFLARKVSENATMSEIASLLTMKDFTSLWGVGEATAEWVRAAFSYCGLNIAEGCHEGVRARHDDYESVDYEEAYFQMRGSWGEACRELERLRTENELLRKSAAPAARASARARSEVLVAESRKART